ncbi:hypothetical protein B7463_g11062, partial [Scytalidium lignicola]
MSNPSNRVTAKGGQTQIGPNCLSSFSQTSQPEEPELVHQEGRRGRRKSRQQQEWPGGRTEGAGPEQPSDDGGGAKGDLGNVSGRFKRCRSEKCDDRALASFARERESQPLPYCQGAPAVASASCSLSKGSLARVAG